MIVNGWGISKILEIDNALELLSNFQLFYYNTGRFPLSSEEKINMKNLYEMFQHTKSHGLVCLQILGVFCLISNDKEIKSGNWTL